MDNVDDNQTTQTTDDNEGLYTVNQINKSQMPRCEVKIEGETIPFLLDAGACDNIIDLDAYKRLSKKVKLTQADKELFAFGSSSKLDFLGKFDARVKQAKSEVMTTVFVLMVRLNVY